MITIYSLKMNRELNERERQQALDILTPERKAKALRFRRSEDQSRGLATGVLELYALWKGFGIPWPDVRLEKGEQGKPFLPGYVDAHYNLSHAGRWIICGTGNQTLGIDVEQSAKYSERIVRKFFHPEEVKDIFSYPPQERPDIFAEYWTMKESFMKLCGTGFHMPLSSFSTDRRNGRIMILPAMKEDLLSERKKEELQKEPPVCQWIELEAGYKCAVCTMEIQEMEQHRVRLEDCLAELLCSNPAAVKADNLSG
ncbi:MAG: 4'-phosphopantetheinyl transferase superfamily protein [Bacteroides sp.]|nr:4'-phosphopantetheinyl transferase superfamily protein [Bacteroides sp.]MCM1550108.1 4'-phosphopantetheinyl transferase superfamily protein [Clostridium sp.]